MTAFDILRASSSFVFLTIISAEASPLIRALMGSSVNPSRIDARRSNVITSPVGLARTTMEAISSPVYFRPTVRTRISSPRVRMVPPAMFKLLRRTALDTSLKVKPYSRSRCSEISMLISYALDPKISTWETSGSN